MFAMFQLVFCKDLFVVLRWKELVGLWKFGQRCEGIDRKVSIIGMFLFEIVSGFYFRIAVLENIYKAIDNLFYLSFCKLRAHPDDEAGYSGHNGLPPCGVVTAFSPISQGGGKLVSRTCWE
jgi:hypothetical protein